MVELGCLCLLKSCKSQQGDYRADNYVDLPPIHWKDDYPDYRDRRLNSVSGMKEQVKKIYRSWSAASPLSAGRQK